MSELNVKQSVQKYYGEELQSSRDLKTNACCTATKIPAYIRDVLPEISEEIKNKYYGCGSCIPLELSGLKVLDLGCGTGRDIYVVAKHVGEQGFVTGIDMTEKQLAVARKYQEEMRSQFGFAKNNVAFIQDEIENIAAHFAPGSLDLITSNCVINLVEDKHAILQQMYQLLKDGGEVYFSDVYADRRIPQEVRKNEVLWGECLGGALYREDFRRICQQVGFLDPRVVEQAEIKVLDDEIKALVGETKFFSITYRLWKIPGLEDRCENFGQRATYLGGIPYAEEAFPLDEGHVFEKGRAERVCGNTALMLSTTRLAPYFQVTGDFSCHLGLFQECSTSAAAGKTKAQSSCC